MKTRDKIIGTGKVAGVALPKVLLANPDFMAKLDLAERIMRSDRDILSTLAK